MPPSPPYQPRDNDLMDAPNPMSMSAAQQSATAALAADLHRIFGQRLHALVAYGLAGDDQLLHTLALVDEVTFPDLAACAPSVHRWRRAGLAVPLLLARDEFERSLDVFPVEYGEIVANHVTIVGHDPFAGAHIAEADLRRSCELQAKSHLIHLREGFLEAGGDPHETVYLIASSVHGFRALLGNIARLDRGPVPPGAPETGDASLAAFAEHTIGVPESVVLEVLCFKATAGAIADPTDILSRYVAATERIWEYVDGWNRR
jgi:hypothetical protein